MSNRPYPPLFGEERDMVKKIHYDLLLADFDELQKKYKAALIIVQPPELDIDKQLFNNYGLKMPPHCRLERRIVVNLLELVTRKGFTLRSVYNGEENTKVDSIKAAMELIFNLDDAYVSICKPGFSKHWIRLVLGEGLDCINDWSFDPEGDPDGFSAMMDLFDTEDYV